MMKTKIFYKEPGDLSSQRVNFIPAKQGFKIWHALLFLTLMLFIQLVLPKRPALAAPEMIEDLHYQLAIWAFRDAAHIRVTLKNQGKGRLIAEAFGETGGLLKLISGNHRERLQTIMVWRQGRLAPLLHREESWHHEKHSLKEYRFDYKRSRLILWQWQESKGLQKKWQTALQEQVYDPLSAFYNCRLRILGPTREGETSTIPGIPYPRPEALEVRLGPKMKDSHQAMVTLVNPVFEDSKGVVYASIDAQRVPRRIWTTVVGVTITGTLLPESVTMPEAFPGLSAPEPVAVR